MLRQKPRIAPRGNEDFARGRLRSACLICAFCQVRILLSAPVPRARTLTKFDDELASLQTGADAKDLYFTVVHFHCEEETSTREAGPRAAAKADTTTSSGTQNHGCSKPCLQDTTHGEYQTAVTLGGTTAVTKDSLSMKNCVERR